MTLEQRQDDGIDGQTTDGSPDTDTPTDDPTVAVSIDADRLSAALDGATAVADECRMRFDDGLVFRARDPADVAMAEFRLDRDAFDAYTADGETVGVALDRLRDAVSVADGEPLELALGDDGRFDLKSGAVEYAFAPLAAETVRQVEWIDGESVAASAVMDSGRLGRAVRAADLVADHATFAVDPTEQRLTVGASGDTDDVSLDFDGDDLESLDTGPDGSDPVESLYSVDYLRDIVGAVPSDVPVSVEFVGGDGGCPLSLEHSRPFRQSAAAFDSTDR
ncbi:DNA polymerase sliding clamp [Halobacteriales archaeon QH_8_67_27]|nr:MAG: DNA polymerase sliding clamp [Halobacteriales archaeon QH_8_67_27]